MSQIGVNVEENGVEEKGGINFQKLLIGRNNA
jgi:hypothetical protein